MLAVVLGYCEKKLVLYWIVDHSPVSVWYQNLSSIADAGQSITTPNSRVLQHFASTYVTKRYPCRTVGGVRCKRPGGTLRGESSK